MNDHVEEHVALESLYDFPGNPNEGDDGLVADSLDHNGWFGAIVANVETRHVLAGHTRKRSLLAAGETHAPLVVWVRVDDEDHARRVLLVDNRSTRVGFDDPARLAEMLEALALNDSLPGSGWDGDDLDAILQTIDREPVAPVVPEPAYCPACGVLLPSTS